MRRLNFLLTGLLAVLLASCNQRVQNIENKPAVKIDTVLSADKQTALQFPGRVKAPSFTYIRWIVPLTRNARLMS